MFMISGGYWSSGGLTNRQQRTNQFCISITQIFMNILQMRKCSFEVERRVLRTEA